MDRLPALTLALVALAPACGKDDTHAGEPTSRVNAAKVTAKKTDTAAFCDKKFDRETAPAFTTPDLAGGALASATTWRWVNVWATWCKPCVEEIPRLMKWRDKLAATTPYELQLVSIDESDDDIAAFRKLHPDTPASPRLAKADAHGAWFTQLGLDAAAPIPVHIFVDPSNHVRCVRAGGVREQDYGMIEALFAGK